MKNLLLTTIAAVVLVGCGESQLPEPPTAKAPDISILDAALSGNIEAVKQHLDAGADVNAKNEYGWTPLHLTDNKEVVELLIAEGADVNAKLKTGHTPLDSAERESRLDSPEVKAAKKEIADLLRKHGGKTGDWLNADKSIHIAARAGHIEAVKQHLAAGTDVDAKDGVGWTPLHHATFGDQKEVADFLIAKGADVNAKDIDGWTPLRKAAWHGRKEIVELLLDKGADVNAKGDDGWTPLHYAVYKGYKEIAELLIAKGADVNAKTNDGRTPLDWAEDEPEPADLLRKHGGKTGEELKAAGN